MAYDKEVVAQVLKNIRLIEETHRVVIAVTEIVEQAINKITEELVSSELDHYCSEASKFDYAKTGDCWFTSDYWQDSEDNTESRAWYYLEAYGDDHASYSLTEYLGETDKPESTLKLGFTYSPVEFGQNKTGCKNTLRSYYEKTEPLRNAGFAISADMMGIELSFKLDKELLAQEYPKFSTALEPLENSLDTLFKHHHLFKQLIEELENK